MNNVLLSRYWHKVYHLLFLLLLLVVVFLLLPFEEGLPSHASLNRDSSSEALFQSRTDLRYLDWIRLLLPFDCGGAGSGGRGRRWVSDVAAVATNSSNFSTLSSGTEGPKLRGVLVKTVCSGPMSEPSPDSLRWVGQFPSPPPPPPLRRAPAFAFPLGPAGVS